ncbi:HK97 gp10 family phage protein [Niallia sp. RD1]|uniref:HK97 gp10 family phage protein n=1 Tax=Niallia sp. RD1 TaxID=2962858 RepID=UPI0020C1B940|nr:HK97 gp10 family phage protein [Niallia sp. RD1]UTI44740.1 HK97 gp10 family phage protein [Niallia sp. RD1]
MRQLELYTEEVKQELEVAKEEVAEETVALLKSNSPKRTGDYAEGWTTKKVGGKVVVHNKTNYQLTHILEKGHANVDGGRTAAQVHIAPAEQKAIDSMVERAERTARG